MPSALLFFFQTLRVYFLFIKALVVLNPTHWELLIRVRRHTLVSPTQLDKVYELIGQLERQKIEGDVVECGVWKGGCAAVMACALANAQSQRSLWLFDSFEGMPEPTKVDGAKAHVYAGHKSEGRLQSVQQCVASLQDVEAIFEHLNLSRKRVHLVKGWFQVTIPAHAKHLQAIGLLRLDGDWYESTKICLQWLYPNVARGGYVIMDDYYRWQGCRKAVDEYLQDQTDPIPHLQRIDRYGVYFVKL